MLVTVASVRGHAPRDAGAKLVVGARETWGTIGGGNVEAVAVDRARALLADPDAKPALFEAALSDKAPYEHGVQCCGGTVTVLLERAVVPAWRSSAVATSGSSWPHPGPPRHRVHWSTAAPSS